MTVLAHHPSWIMMRFLAALPARALSWLLLLIGATFTTLAGVVEVISRWIEGI